MTARKRAALIADAVFAETNAGPEVWSAVADVAARHLEEYRREGMLEMRQACAVSTLTVPVQKGGDPREALRSAYSAVLSTPLPGESEPT